MRTLLKKLIPESPILKAILVFSLGLVASGILWIQVKDSYCYMITLAASKLLAGVKDAQVDEILQMGDAFSITFRNLKGSGYAFFVIDLSSTVSRYYAFTVPFMLSLLASLFIFTKRRMRAFAEAFSLLFLSHLLYVFFTEAMTMTEQFMLRGIEPMNLRLFSFYQYLWKTAEFTVMSFAPFLISAYVFVRFKR